MIQYESRDEKSYHMLSKAWITWAVDVDEYRMRSLESRWNYPNYGDCPNPTITWYLRIARESKSLHGLPKILALAQTFAGHGWKHGAVAVYRKLFRFKLNISQFFVHYSPFMVLLLLALICGLDL